MRRLYPALLVGIALIVSTSSSGVGGATSTAAQQRATSRSQTSRVYLAPLTGRPDRFHVTKHRSALTIKIDNTPQARPQYGIEKADVIYEEIAEGGITRLAAIFNSVLPTRVGPVRSVRKTDRDIVDPIGGVFACSGGAQYALQSIATAPVKLVDQANAGPAMFRDFKRYAPHNLYANAVLLMARGGTPKPPLPLFRYANGSRRVAGRPVSSFVVGFSAGFATSYRWNNTTKSWARWIFGRPDVTASGRQLSPTNVIVMTVHYLGGVGVEGSEAQLVGSGPVEVFSAGRMQRGHWRRVSRFGRTVYRSTTGKFIFIRPGQTWVELLDVSEHVRFVARPS